MVAMAALLVALVALVGEAVGATGSEAPAPPEYNGTQLPRAIEGPSDSEEFSWRVHLDARQELRQVSETVAAVVYESGVVSFTITAELAHAADGTPVPTTLRVSEGDILTLIVHHRAGNLKAGGAPFAYPIVAGEGWESGPSTPVIVKGPPDEAESKAAAEAAAAAARAPAPAPTNPPPAAPVAVCTVPALHGLSLRGAKARLRAGDCAIGKVRFARRATARGGDVVKQSSPAGTELAAGARVAIRLGAR